MRATGRRSRVLGQPPRPTPNQRASPLRPRTHPDVQTASLPGTEKPCGGAGPGIVRCLPLLEAQPPTSALHGQSPRETPRGPPPTLVLHLSPFGRIGPKPPRTPWVVGPHILTWPLSSPTSTWTPSKAWPLN